MNIAIIPARGGSQRIPLKNIRKFLGKPIISYSIAAAINSNLFDRVIVSTDNNVIAEIANECGAETPFIRPEGLSDDFTGTHDVIGHAVKLLENSGEKYDFIISGLPHINFPTTVVEAITAAYFNLLKPGGMLSYFEYMYVRPLRKMVTLGNDRQRVREVNAIMEAHIGRHRIRRESILINVPPVWVQRLHLDATV